MAEIVDWFSISEATARRDLETLAGQGKIQRVHGGAIALTEAPPETPLLQRGREQAKEKTRIGFAAAALVQNGKSVLLGSGTTVLEVAYALRSLSNLTIITNSLPVVNVFSSQKNINLIVLGGMLRDSEQSFIGHITEQALAEVRADKVFIGTHAVSLVHGLMNEYLPETMTDRAILKSGQEIIVVADHTKFGRAATSLLAPLENIHTIVTDKQTPQEFIAAIQQKGVRVIVA